VSEETQDLLGEVNELLEHCEEVIKKLKTEKENLEDEG